MRRLIIGAVLCLALVLLVVFRFALRVGDDAFQAVFGEEYERFRQVQLGMTEADVVSILGAPLETHEASSAPDDYYVDGWSFERRKIENKVYIYIASEPICYVYFDHQDRVEHVFIGGS